MSKIVWAGPGTDEYTMTVVAGVGGEAEAVRAAPVSESQMEFQRFIDLAGKLVHVPKSELDEKLKEGD